MAESSSRGSVETVAEAVERELREKLENAELESLREFTPTIWKIPANVRKGFDDAYEPKFISIGPFHREKENTALAPTAKLKLLYVQDLLKRHELNDLKHYTLAVARCEEAVRLQYSEDIGLTTKELVKLLVIDGCFVIEFFLKRAEGRVGKPLSASKRNGPALRHDLLLMENQIPFFVLRTILDETRYEIPNHQDLTLLDLALHYLGRGNIKKENLPREYREERTEHGEKIYHLLHLSYLCLLLHLEKEGSSNVSQADTLKAHLQGSIVKAVRGLFARLGRVRCLLSWLFIGVLYIMVLSFEVLINWRMPSWHTSEGDKTQEEKNPRNIPTATELKEAGVRFTRKKNARCQLDVSFDDGTMEIGRVKIQENTGSTFRNFLALEQTCAGVGNDFTSYVVLMDNLIDTAADVAILRRRGIVESKLGCDQDVADFFNRMRYGLCFDFDEHYLADLFAGVEEYCKWDHNKWRATLMHEYFSNPWVILSIFAAVVLLALTAVQTAYSVKSFKHDHAGNA